MVTKTELINHANRLANVVRSAQLKRALTLVDPTPRLGFWSIIYGNLLDVAVLEWCKLFGADSEPTHWKRVVADHDAFRQDLLKSMGIDEGRWVDYWNEMKAYRDAQVAHDFVDPDVTRYPSLDFALKSSYFYYIHVISELRKLGEQRFPDNLEEYGTRFAAQARQIAANAIASTRTFEEKVF
jgi:hypothetical protein